MEVVRPFAAWAYEKTGGAEVASIDFCVEEVMSSMSWEGSGVWQVQRTAFWRRPKEVQLPTENTRSRALPVQRRVSGEVISTSPHFLVPVPLSKFDGRC